VARAAARGRRSGAKQGASSSKRVLKECAGVALLGASLLAALALATHSKTDPILEGADESLHRVMGAGFLQAE